MAGEGQVTRRIADDYFRGRVAGLAQWFVFQTRLRPKRMALLPEFL